jgi:hypothetical protein
VQSALIFFPPKELPILYKEKELKVLHLLNLEVLIKQVSVARRPETHYWTSVQMKFQLGLWLT